MRERPHIPARPTVYKGIKMRSRLEADYASALDRDGESWEYEPTCFAGPDGQWLPDFRVGQYGTYVEIKPAYLIEWDGPEPQGTWDRIDKILQRMTVAWLSEPEVVIEAIFWTYGAEQVSAPLSILGSKGRPWVINTPSTLDLPLLWPGMGQYDAAAASASEGLTEIAALARDCERQRIRDLASKHRALVHSDDGQTHRPFTDFLQDPS